MGNSDDDDYIDPEAQKLYEEIVKHGRQIVRGIEGLRTLRKVLEEVVRRAEIAIEWDPRTPAKMKDYLTIGATTSARWAIAGVAAGLLASVFFKRPAACMIACGTAATLAGGVQAYLAVKQGWRLRGYLDTNGVEHVEVSVKALPTNSSAAA